ncbi:hypothetical protein BC833DRAFT_587615 [Globomyces pollinis-pini]|nr:hypothetical protein BC833DRAFT_587615 [Globomyces pollinis-pini]
MQVVEGQFSDVESDIENNNEAINLNNHNDSSKENSEEQVEVEFWDEEYDSELEYELQSEKVTMDIEEWDACNGDFTKKYNRMRSQLSTLSQSQVTNDTKQVKGQILNYIKQRQTSNVPKLVKVDVANKNTVETATTKDDQINELTVKFSSRIKLNEPIEFFANQAGHSKKADDG